MALISINVIVDGDPEACEGLSKDFVSQLKRLGEGRIYDATFVTVAGEGRRVNLNEIVVSVETTGEQSSSE